MHLLVKLLTRPVPSVTGFEHADPNLSLEATDNQRVRCAVEAPGSQYVGLPSSAWK